MLFWALITAPFSTAQQTDKETDTYYAKSSNNFTTRDVFMSFNFKRLPLLTVKLKTTYSFRHLIEQKENIIH